MKISSETKSPVDAILIDDDMLVHMAWEYAARTSGKRLQCFAGFASFEQSPESIAPETPIFIDSNLGSGIRGEEIARDLFARGHRRIYLVTGHRADDFEELPWITEIIDKMPPTWFFRREGNA